MLDLPHENFGVMISPQVGFWRHSLSKMWWAGDNGRFKSPDKWVESKWLDWMAGLVQYQPRCLFMVCPDVLSDPVATNDYLLFYSGVIRQLGYKVAYVSQDGADQHEIDWNLLDCLFIGGSTEWKLSEASYELAREAHDRHKWVHMGRVNGLRRVKAAQAAKVDSVDGTYIAFEPGSRVQKVVDWLTETGAQPALP